MKVSSATGAATYIESSATISSSAVSASGADAKARRVSSCSARASQSRSGAEQRLLFAERRPFTSVVQQLPELIRELVGFERTAEHQRERDESDARDIRTVIESWQARAGRHRDSEFLPEPIAAELKLLDRGRQHVLDDHEPRVRRDDQALRRDQTVRDFARVLVQQRHRRNELADQAQCSIDIELQISLVRDAQDVGEPRPFDVVGHDGESRSRHRDAIDPAHPRVVGVAEVREPRRTFAQRELERRNCE